MHIFLTGEIQIGKSTIIAKTLPLLNKIPGGFRTYFGPDRESPEKTLDSSTPVFEVLKQASKGWNHALIISFFPLLTFFLAKFVGIPADLLL